MNRRSDRFTALLIDAAIHAAESYGPVGAAKSLIEAGVTWAVIMRVFSRPNERRSYLRPTSADLGSRPSVTQIAMTRLD